MPRVRVIKLKQQYSHKNNKPSKTITNNKIMPLGNKHMVVVYCRFTVNKMNKHITNYLNKTKNVSEQSSVK